MTEQKTVEVYVELLEEGTDTWRPTQAVDLGNGAYKLLATPDYDPENEIWAFLPGSIVKCRKSDMSGMGDTLIKDVLLVYDHFLFKVS